RSKQSGDYASSNSGTGEPHEISHSGMPNFSPIIAQTSNKTYKPIDSRTGTPTFMSTRVLRVSVGERYEHHFMDDLESFFWLTLWCVAQHTDRDPEGNAKNPSQKALDSLRHLDRADSDFETLAASKNLILTDCNRNKLKAQLEAYNNAWVNDQAIARVIIKIGKCFFKVNIIDTEVECYKPETEFPELVNIILEGLEAMDLGIEQRVT
ncbi:hypothetical protein FRC11_003237, partial [Ceratobasidium sp. 423]